MTFGQHDFWSTGCGIKIHFISSKEDGFPTAEKRGKMQQDKIEESREIVVLTRKGGI
jgi:hypothetical protein